MKLSLIILMFLLPFLTFAQLERGNKLIGGEIGFNSLKWNGANKAENILNISPSAGIFVANNFALGMALNFSNQFKRNTSIGLTPFVRYYVKKFFAQAKFGYTYSKDRLTEYKFNYLNYGVSVGYAAFVTEKISIEPAFYYDVLYSINTGIKQNRNLGLKIGIQVYL